MPFEFVCCFKWRFEKVRHAKSFDSFDYVRMSSSSIDEAQRPLAKPPPNEPARKPEPPPRRRPSLVQQKSS
jgi:hypothetical protein